MNIVKFILGLFCGILLVAFVIGVLSIKIPFTQAVSNTPQEHKQTQS